MLTRAKTNAFYVDFALIIDQSAAQYVSRNGLNNPWSKHSHFALKLILRDSTRQDGPLSNFASPVCRSIGSRCTCVRCRAHRPNFTLPHDEWRRDGRDVGQLSAIQAILYGKRNVLADVEPGRYLYCAFSGRPQNSPGPKMLRAMQANATTWTYTVDENGGWNGTIYFATMTGLIPATSYTYTL